MSEHKIHEDTDGTKYIETGEKRIPKIGDHYMGSGILDGLIMRRSPGAYEDSCYEEHRILKPLMDATHDEVLYGFREPRREPKSHPMARFIKNVEYQNAGRATAAIATVILPGNGAMAILTGLGLSVANTNDRFSYTEGRRLALLRALDNIQENMGGNA